MNARNRIIGAAAALALAVGAAVGLAPGASAILPSHIVDNDNGTATVTYPLLGDDQGVYFCDPSFTASNLSQCNVDTYTFVAGRLAGTMPPSPALLHEGMAVHRHTGPALGLPGGRYTLVFAAMEGGSIIRLAGLQNVWIANPATGVIPPWVQAIGRFAADSCPPGWGASWQQWAVPVTGGYVCTREVPSLG